jgi:hypothetical protein
MAKIWLGRRWDPENGDPEIEFNEILVSLANSMKFYWRPAMQLLYKFVLVFKYLQIQLEVRMEMCNARIQILPT